jgi:hypothetical protein
MDVQEAIELPRFASLSFPNSFAPFTYLPGRMMVEDRVPAAVLDDLRGLGHEIQIMAAYSRRLGAGDAIIADRTSCGRARTRAILPVQSFARHSRGVSRRSSFPRRGTRRHHGEIRRGQHRQALQAEERHSRASALAGKSSKLPIGPRTYIPTQANVPRCALRDQS